jgi:hypothetical protein
MATRAELFEVIDDQVGPRGTIPASQSPAGTGTAVFLTLKFALYGCPPDSKENLCRVVKKSAASLYPALIAWFVQFPELARWP